MATVSFSASTKPPKTSSKSKMVRFTRRFIAWRNAAGSSRSGACQTTTAAPSFIDSQEPDKNSSKHNAPTGIASPAPCPRFYRLPNDENCHSQLAQTRKSPGDAQQQPKNCG